MQFWPHTSIKFHSYRTANMLYGFFFVQKTLHGKVYCASSVRYTHVALFLIRAVQPGSIADAGVIPGNHRLPMRLRLKLWEDEHKQKSASSFWLNVIFLLLYSPVCMYINKSICGNVATTSS